MRVQCLEERFKTFVGVDNIPMAHGMTIGELARFFQTVQPTVSIRPYSGMAWKV